MTVSLQLHMYIVRMISLKSYTGKIDFLGIMISQQFIWWLSKKKKTVHLECNTPASINTCICTNLHIIPYPSIQHLPKEKEKKNGSHVVVLDEPAGTIPRFQTGIGPWSSSLLTEQLCGNLHWTK